MKNNFILYTDYFEQIKLLSVEQRGILLTALMCYQLEEELPTMDPLTQMCYSFISADVRRNNEKYEEIIEKRKQAGAKGGKQTQANQANARFASEKKTTVRGSQANQANQANADDNVNVKVNVNDNVNDKVNVSGNVKVNVGTSNGPTTTTTQTDFYNIPTKEQITEYCNARGIRTNIDQFISYNNVRNWKVNGNQADWRDLLELWTGHDSERNPLTDQGGKYDYDALERALCWQEG